MLISENKRFPGLVSGLPDRDDSPHLRWVETGEVLRDTIKIELLEMIMS
jgi:hypothetical protein